MDRTEIVLFETIVVEQIEVVTLLIARRVAEFLLIVFALFWVTHGIDSRAPSFLAKAKLRPERTLLPDAYVCAQV